MAFTRAASAASSHRAKQELVRLLFGRQYYRRGPDAHRRLDHSIYTHAELKSAYLQRLQELHPDKRRNQILAHKMENNNNNMDEASQEFISLQEAWRRYEEFAKALTKVSNGSASANFTQFGVGCSFSDNEAERDRRSEITDQACRGWFSAGEIGVGGNDSSSSSPTTTKTTMSLLDDDMFVTTETTTEIRSSSSSTTTRRKSLIDHMVRRAS